LPSKDVASDFLVGALITYPFVVDSGAVALGARGSPEPALQLALIGAESFASAMLSTQTGTILSAREPPPSADCRREGGRMLFCTEKRFQSFPSGHTNLAVTGGSSTGALHERIDLYGGGLADRTTRWTSIGAAIAAGLFRVASRNLYFTNVLPKRSPSASTAKGRPVRPRAGAHSPLRPRRR